MSRSNKVRKLNNANVLLNIIYNADGLPVRKVCFSFEYEDLTAQQNITESLFGYVIRIGRIQSWHLWSSAKYTNGNVIFEQPEHATQLLYQSGCSFSGAFVHFCESMNLLSLPNECRQGIFRNLDVNDLISVAQVNERFKRNAKSVFSLKFDSFKISIDDDNEESDKWMNDIHRLEKFLPAFGEFVVEIDFNYDAFESSSINRVFELFALHCSDSLKKLHLDGFRSGLKDALVCTMEPLLARLTSLEIFHCDVSNRFIESLSSCRELNLLEMWNTNGNFQSLQFTLPKLETIDIYNAFDLKQQQMEIFLRQNPQLKDVILCSDVGMWPIFSAIGQYLPQIEKLLLSVEGFIDQPTFSRDAFASLKELTIECSPTFSASATISALAAAQVPLEYLSLFCSPDDQLIDAISELKTIKKLSLTEDDSRLLRIIDNLKELDYLKFDQCDTLNADGLVKIVQNAKKLQQLDLWLKIEINSETCAAMVEILKNRAVNRHLTINTLGINFASNSDPTHQEFLTFSRQYTEIIRDF